MTNNFETGATYQFELLNGLGYSYFKFIDFRSRNPNMLLINVFDLVTKDAVKSTDEIKLKELLFGACCFVGSFPRNKKKYGIKYLGKTVHKFDNFVPDLVKMKSLEEIKKGFDPYSVKWRPVVNFELMPECPFEIVRNLEGYSLVSIVDIQVRATMEVCRKKEIDIGKMFDLEDPTYYIHYFDTMRTEYSKIPKEDRGIAKGYENVNRWVSISEQ